MNDLQSQQFRRQIELERRKLLRDENVLHNKILHNSILETWKQGSPKMWARLQRLKLTDKLAYVLQQRMWARQEELMRAGLPVTDAREQAERETLMLEPEAQDQQNPVEALTE